MMICGAWSSLKIFEDFIVECVQFEKLNWVVKVCRYILSIYLSPLKLLR